VLDKATLSGVLDRLQEAGWIDKRPDDEDRRISRLYTTPKADSAKNELIAVRMTTNEVLLEGFALEERLLLKRFLRELMGGSHH
jgi:DNA-binding MarR family transcriptional regulator